MLSSVPFYSFSISSRPCIAAAAAAKLLQSCLTLQPHRLQPTRLPHPWDSPGKNTGVGCHFLLQHMKVKSESEVTQLCPTLSDPMDCSLPGSSVHGIFQAKSTGVGRCITCPQTSYFHILGSFKFGSYYDPHFAYKKMQTLRD